MHLAMHVIGKVEKGLGIAGPLLGTPTANLRLDQLPDMPRGVYAAIVMIDEQPYPSVVCYGADDTREKFEVHIIGLVDVNLVGQTLAVEMMEKIRDLVPWESADQMRACIMEDIGKTKEILVHRSER